MFAKTREGARFTVTGLMIETDTANRPTIGRYTLTRLLQPTALAERWLAVHANDHSSHVLYRFAPCHDKAEQRRFMAAVARLSAVEHPHLLRIEQFSFDRGARPWLITPFNGDVDGITTLRTLLRYKGGEMSPDEAERALVQLLQAVHFAHDLGLHHGPIDMNEIHVDRRGSLYIELYGLSRAIRGAGEANPETIRDEVRSLVEIAYTLITGLRAEEPLIPAGRLVKRLSGAWDEWFDHGLNPAGGFDSASEAMDALPAARAARGERPIVRTRIRRLRPARR